MTFHRRNVFQNYNETLNHADNLAPKTTKTDIFALHTLQITHELVGITMMLLSLNPEHYRLDVETAQLLPGHRKTNQ